MTQASVNQHQPFIILRKMQHGFMHAFKRMINYLESADTLLVNCIFTFIACLLLRNFLEAFAKTSANFLNVDSSSVLISLVHFDASFLAVALALSIAMHYVTKTPVIPVLKVILPSFILLAIAPIVDFILTGSQGYGYAYFDTNQNLSLIYSYLSFYGQFSSASIGIKLEVFIALIGLFLYGHYKTQSYWKALFGCWLVYTIIFIYGISQFILNGLFNLVGLSYVPSGLNFLTYFFMLNFVLGIWVAFLADKKAFITLLGEIPFLRILNYEIMFLIGACLAFRANVFAAQFLIASNPAIVGDFLLLAAAIFFALLFVMAINNLEDIEIDKISNSDRAVVAGKISRESYAKIANAYLGLSLIYAAPTGTQGVFFVALFMAIYYLYSSYPMRLKRITIISKLAISVNSLLLILLGYWVVTHDFFINLNLNMSYLVILFICFTLAANFIDLKDVYGDKAAGIKTLPVVIGMRKAQYFCGITFFLSYILMAFMFFASPILFGFLILGGSVQFYLLTRTKYIERPVLYVYLASLLFLIVFGFASQYLMQFNHVPMPGMSQQNQDAEPPMMMPPPQDMQPSPNNAY